MKVKSPSESSVRKKYSDWFDAYQYNNDRGRQCIAFTQSNRQWDASYAGSRAEANKETLVLNNCKKYENRILNQSRQIDFMMDISPVNKSVDIKKTNAFKMFVKHIYNSSEQQSIYFKALEKCVTFGYSVVWVTYGRENKDTLNLIPVNELIDDPSSCYFDPTAKHPNKIDGNFCGFKSTLSKESIQLLDPALAKRTCVQENSNMIVYHFYRQKFSVNYVKLMTGVYKDVKLCTEEDVANYYRDALGNTDVKTDYNTKIYLARYCNNVLIDAPEEYPTDDMPLVYHDALTFWSPSGKETYPYTFYLQDAQKLHNFVGSQLATALKNSTSAKYFVSRKQIENEGTKQDMANVNSIEGTIPITPDPAMPNGMPYKVPADEIPQSLLAMSSQSSQEVESIAGSMMEMQPSDNVVVSGIAMKEVTKNIQLMSSGLVAAHIKFIDAICKIQTQMIPKIITEERVMCVEDNNGKIVEIAINQKTGTDIVINDIKDISNSFKFTIKASASTTMQEENTINSLTAIYAVNPQAFLVTADIFTKMLPTPYADELSRRFQATMDQPLLAYGNGEISLEEFQSIQKRKQQEQQAQEQTMMQNNPEFKAMQSASQAEHEKAAAAQQNADTNEKKQIVDAMAKQNAHELDSLKLQMTAQSKAMDLNMERLKQEDENFRQHVQMMLAEQNKIKTGEV